MKIWKLTNNRIYFGEDEFYRTSIDIIIEFNLKKGMTIEGDEERKLLAELLFFRACTYLARKDYTEKELKNKLKLEFFKQAPFEDAIEKLKEKGYVDDYSYARNYIESKNLSKKRICFDLTTKGVKKEYIDEIYSETEIDEKGAIGNYLVKLGDKDKRKKIEYLLRKGYNLRDILEVIKENEK